VGAISAQEDTPNAQVWFDINLRLSQKWPRITKKKPALPDAEEWKDKPNKIDLLEE
jgi:ferredoxin